MIVLGEHDLERNPDNNGAAADVIYRGVEKVIIHEDYDIDFQSGAGPTLLTNSKEKKSVFTFRIQNILSKALQLQGHKGRCVQFATCVKYFIFNASCELHRPAFMTLEPIR